MFSESPLVNAMCNLVKADAGGANALVRCYGESE
jgi:hypothetical protein